MKVVQFKVKKKLIVPVDSQKLSPNNIVGKSEKEIRKTEIWEGNQRTELGKIFDVNGNPGEKLEEVKIKIIGDVSKVRRIGQKMDGGTIQIVGDAGMHLGNEMKNGIITVLGNTESWLGSNMRGGMIEVKGNTGDFVGATYRGNNNGMRDGVIKIHGNAGSEVGCWMSGGVIRILRGVGIFPGIHMKGGTIYVRENCLGRAGAQMTGGKIILAGKIPDILPSFSIEELRGDTKAGQEKISGPFYLFKGDHNEDGNGRLFVKIENNTHLKWFEKFIDNLNGE